MVSSKSCFVIMPIGNQRFVDGEISAEDLKSRYDDLIKEAILKAYPDLEVVRADEISVPGTITSDILTRIMHSEIVIADVTFPNPNVFYELGLRHACRPGTIIIRDKNGPRVPFDIAHLRHIEYENTPSGLKKLAEDLKAYLMHFNKNPDRPDNHLLELAKLTNYQFQNYVESEISPEEAQFDAFISIMQIPEVADLLMRKASGEEVSQAELTQAIIKYPDTATTLLKTLFKSEGISLTNNTPKRPTQMIRTKSKRKRRR